MMQLDYTFERQIELEREEGRRESILNLIKKKLAKGKTLEQIADELEETPEALRAFYDQVKSELTSGTTE